jgi:hypothetical protein
MASEDAEVRDVYAHFGLAIYLAQCLEHELVNALVYVSLLPDAVKVRPKRGEWIATFDSFMDRNFQLTLGQLIARLRSASTLPGDLEEGLGRALTLRNYLAHAFFRERAEDFVTSRGRRAMTSELREAQAVFLESSEQLELVMKSIRSKSGISDEVIEKHVAEYLKSVERDI